MQLKVSVTPHLKCITNSLRTVKDSFNALIYSLCRKVVHSPEDGPRDINKINITSLHYYQCLCVSVGFVALECATVNAQVFINSVGFYSN